MRNEPNQSLTGTSMAVSRGPTHVSISIFLQKRNTAIACSSPWKADMRDMRIFLAKVRSHRFPAALPWPSVWAAIWWNRIAATSAMTLIPKAEMIPLFTAIAPQWNPRGCRVTSPPRFTVSRPQTAMFMAAAAAVAGRTVKDRAIVPHDQHVGLPRVRIAELRAPLPLDQFVKQGQGLAMVEAIESDDIARAAEKAGTPRFGMRADERMKLGIKRLLVRADVHAAILVVRAIHA